MLKNIRQYFYGLKKYQRPLEKYFFPLIIIFYPLIGVNAGLDITDTMYSLVNYEYLGNIDPMWILSTFLGNVLGNAIMHLPCAGTLFGMGVYCSLLIGLFSLFIYYMLQDYMPGWMIFIGLFMAESLCWCPKVILYNYLTYILMSVGIIFLLKGMFSWNRQNLYLLIAGIALGLNVMVRFPNILEAALILILWFYCFITKEQVIDAVKKTLVCIAGYLIGFGIPYIIISIIYGPLAYINMISSLFGMTEGASDYSSSGMLAMILDAYRSSLLDMMIMIPCVAAGIILFLLYKGKYIWTKKIVYIAGILVLIRYFFARGIFTRNYYYYDSIFKAAMMFVIISVIISFIGSIGLLNGSKQEQTMAFSALMIILLTPIGSNNYTYPVLNNLFVAAPIALWLFRRLIQRMGEEEYNFAWQAIITSVIIVLMVQGFLFHWNFSFSDGADGTVRNTVASGIKKAEYMVTSGENAGSLEKLNTFLQEQDICDGKAIIYGGIPGISYLFDLEPALDTVWPDLDSYSVDKFVTQLNNSELSSEMPSIIIGKNMQEYANVGVKYDILLDYIDNHDYNKVFESDRFIVFTTGNESEE
ncbi:hypothetical protein [Butyrivibrio sp. YAB3001]|uniref:hypothetical protein n=1 Tax=Butyrivibrio sp. YAB3001 TaxID=1520812 RepID=UPI0008F617C9|nr:hypothetical protein [Butyrivibrio sp. YAB3001]SFC16809.1 hypothetical protein SAMN02910398_01625 [Butyrivibrio sp. YAB3001]